MRRLVLNMFIINIGMRLLVVFDIREDNNVKVIVYGEYRLKI